MGIHNNNSTMLGKKSLKRLGDAQRRMRQNEITSSMTSKFLVRLIKELSEKLPELSTSKLGL